MKALIVSHNVFSATNNMGKTLQSYFSAFGQENIAQFYIHSESPADTSACAGYYRFTDLDAVRSIFFRRKGGCVFEGRDFPTDHASAGVGQQIVESVYIPGGKRRPLTMLLREIVWAVSGWKCKKLREWLRTFDPDVIFYAAGDYGFSYTIASWIADYLRKPLALLCVDDFYTYNRNGSSLAGKLHYRFFMKTVRRTMERASCIFTICDKMGEEYEKLFGVPCYTLHTGAVQRTSLYRPKGAQISYIGNLSLGRFRQLIDMGGALQSMNLADVPGIIDVYSEEKSPAILEALRAAPGIRFHGPISSEEVCRVMADSMAVIHTESFEEDIRNVVRYSVSTKIADTLMNGPCLIAYGPEGIASVDYLKQNGAAFVITSKEDLASGLCSILSDAALRAGIVRNARLLAQKNHRADSNSRMILSKLSSIAAADETDAVPCNSIQ